MDMVIKDTVFEKIADSVKPDAKRRVVLQGVQIQEGVSYHIYKNSIGQIVLDPQLTIPASEIWLFNNPKALSSVMRGLSDAAQGRVSKVDLDALWGQAFLFELQWTAEASETYNLLKGDASQKKRYKSVKKTIYLLATNPRHNSLQTHEYMSLKGPNGEKVFEAYAEQKTPAAYRVFWFYGPSMGKITIFAITPHP